MKNRNKHILIIGLISTAFVLFIIFVYLPMAKVQDDTTKFVEALYPSPILKLPVKKVPDFNFTNQNGLPFSQTNLIGKVYVADFFFTSCEAACPMMTTQLTRVQQSISNTDQFAIVSFSLDPDNDSAAVLRTFAEKFGADEKKWQFLTGPKHEIYTLGEQGFLQSVLNDSAQFINHTQKFILVDKKGMIRGFYNSADSLDIKYLINDVNFLIYKEES